MYLFSGTYWHQCCGDWFDSLRTFYDTKSRCWDEHYFRVAAGILVAINPKTTTNIVLLYRALDFLVNCCMLLFLRPLLEINFDKFSDNFVLNLFIAIHLKQINSDLTIFIVNHDDFQSCWSCHLKEICKTIWRIFDLNLQKLISVSWVTQKHLA